MSLQPCLWPGSFRLRRLAVQHTTDALAPGVEALYLKSQGFRITRDGHWLTGMSQHPNTQSQSMVRASGTGVTKVSGFKPRQPQACPGPALLADVNGGTSVDTPRYCQDPPLPSVPELPRPLLSDVLLSSANSNSKRSSCRLRGITVGWTSAELSARHLFQSS